MTQPTPSTEPPFPLDGYVAKDKLRDLLGVQSESAWLDYKQATDLRDRKALVELVKDIGAMCIRSGYLVVGAGEGGEMVGISDASASLFDEATLRAKIKRYLPPNFGIAVGVHTLVDDAGVNVTLAVVWVSPHPDGWAIFAADGSYEEPDKDGKMRTKFAFREGEVFARHGSASERWDQHDVAAARANLVASERDKWRAETAAERQQILAESVAASVAVTSPSSSYTWQLDAAGFEAATVELIRARDDIPIRRMLPKVEEEVRRAVSVPNPTGDEADESTVALDRVTTLAALGLELDRPEYFAMGVKTFLGVYGWAMTDLGVLTSAHRLVPVMHLRIAERLYALGALAVRMERWTQVRELAIARIPGASGNLHRTWHSDALTNASRARLLTNENGQGERSLLAFARAAAAASPALHPDLQGDLTTATHIQDPLLPSLAQFDFYAATIAGVDAHVTTDRELRNVAYPNFGQYDGANANPAATVLAFDPEVRQVLIPGATDDELAIVYALIDKAAQKAGQTYWGWEGYTDPRVRDLIDRVMTELSEDLHL